MSQGQRPELGADALSKAEVDFETSRLFFELPFLGMAVTSPGDKRWRLVNQTLCDILGYTKQALLQRTWTEITHPEDLTADVAHFDRIMRGESDGYKTDKRYLHSDGSVVYTSIDVKAIRRADHSVNFFVATVADITARVKAENEARAAAALMKKVAENVPGVLYQYQRFEDGRACFPFASAGIREIYEVEPEEVRHDAGPALERIDPEDRAMVTASLEASAQGLTPWRCEYRVHLPQQGLRWLRSEARPEHRPDGSTLWHGFTTDITHSQLQHLALEESEERFRLQTEHAPDAILAFEPATGRIVDANSKAQTMFGLSRDRLLNLGWQDLSPETQPDGQPSAEAGAARIRRTLEGETSVFEWTTRLAGGRTDPCEVRLTRLPFHGAQLVRASITDIGERLEKEARLKISEDRLLQAVRCSQAGIFDHDLVQDTLYWSSELRQIYDVDPDAPASIPLLIERIHPEDRASTGEVVLAAQDPQSDGRLDGEFRIKCRDGELRRLSVRAQTQFARVDGELRAVRTIGAVTDITERHRANEALLSLQAAVDSTPSAIAMANPEGRLTYVNQAFIDLWGFDSPQEVLGRHVSFFWQSRDESTAIIDTIRAHGTWDGERTARRADGSERILHTNVSLSRDSNNEPSGMLGFFIDITESRALQARLLQSQKMESIGRLAGGIAHDFNNLLTVIKGYLELVEMSQPEGEGLCAELQEVDRAADLAVALTQQLLAFSRRQIIAPVLLNLNSVVQTAHGMLKRVLGEDIVLQTQTEPELWLVSFDPGQAEQILLNLAANARDAMPHGGRLTLETANVVLGEEYVVRHSEATRGEFVMLAVSDTGAGMDPETRAHAFEPFYTTKGAGQGTGLGLAVIHGAVSQNGGRVELYSEPGHGTCFKIYLPRAHGTSAETQDLAKPQIPTGRETILLAEDDEGVRLLAVRLLQSLGYEVHAFANPAEALTWLEYNELPVHLLVTDVIMPGMNGKELAERVVALRPEIQVLFVSGYTANVIVHHGVLKPGVEFLAKPYSREQLAVRLRQLLDR